MTMTSPMIQIRAKFPRLRRSGPVAIVHSGQGATVFGCLCGATHSAESSTRGRNARHVTEFFTAHKGCAANLAARLGMLKFAHKSAREGRVVTTLPILTETTN